MFFIMIWSDNEFQLLKIKDKEALKKFYTSYSDKVYNFLLIKLNGNRDMAEELASDTFMSAFNSLDKIKNKKTINAWLLQIAYRRFIDYLRKHYREKKYLNKVNNDDLIQDDDMVEKLHIKEKVLMVKLAMEKLKPNYQEVIRLKYIDHKSQKDIAEIINNTVSAVENLLFKARKALKKELEKLSREYDETK